MNTLATVEIQRHGDISLVQARGEIAASNVREVADALEAEGLRTGADLGSDAGSTSRKCTCRGSSEKRWGACDR